MNELLRFCLDASRQIDRHIAACQEDLIHGSEAEQEAASEELRKWLPYTIRPQVPLPSEEGSDATSAKGGSRYLGRRRGRPRVNGQRTVEGLTLYMCTSMGWREITKAVGGSCCHLCSACFDTIRKREGRIGQTRHPRQRCEKCDSTIRPLSQRQTVCDACADATRDSVERLKALMVKAKLLPTAVRIGTLKNMSCEEIAEVWPEQT